MMIITTMVIIIIMTITMIIKMIIMIIIMRIIIILIIIIVIIIIIIIMITLITKGGIAVITGIHTSVTSVKTARVSKRSQNSPSVGHDHRAALAAAHRNAIPANRSDIVAFYTSGSPPS